MRAAWFIGAMSLIVALTLGYSAARIDGMNIGNNSLMKAKAEKTILLADAKKQKQKSDDKKRGPYVPEKEIFQWFQTYSEVISIVEKKAFRQVDFSKFIQDSLKSAVSNVDAHSAFFSQKSYKSAIESTSGEFSGIGVSIITKGTDDEALIVVDVIQGGPSYKAGLKPGDKIVEVGGVKLKGLNADEVVGKLKGKVGTKVDVKVIRNKKPLSFTITRDIIKDQTSMCYKFVEQNVYYLSLKIFNEVAAQQVENLLVKANKGACRGIILDLRRNPGGTLESAIEMGGLFLKKGSLVVSTKDKNGKVVQTYKTNRDPVLKSDVPIFILIDNFTASASEILAGALKHHSMDKDNHKNLKVFLVGTSTFGKGSVQELIPIKNGCAIKITSMLYYLPDDSSIQAVGIHPDFPIKPKMTPEEEIKWIHDLYGKETSLKGHITAKEVDDLKKGKKQSGFFWSRIFGGGDDAEEKKQKKEEQEKSWEQKRQEALAQDVQVQASVNLINLLDLAKQLNKKMIGTREQTLTFLKKNYLSDEAAKLEEVK